MGGVEKSAKGKQFNELPPAFKFFIENQFRSIDIDGDGAVGIDEFRVDCVNRMAYKTIGELDAAYEKLLNDDDKKAGGITLERYQELYAQFIGNLDETSKSCFTPAKTTNNKQVARPFFLAFLNCIDSNHLL